MTRLTPLALLLALLICGFGPGKEAEEPAPDAEEEGEDVMDSSQSTIDMYVNGTIKASYWCTVHADPKAGQYWETFYEAYGMKSTTVWQVASVDGTTAIVENRMKIVSEYMRSDYVLAYQVDLSAAAGEVNVNKAWIGKPGKAGTEIQIMEKPEPMADGGASADYEMTEEAFTDYELGGGKWSGKLVTIKGDGWESKSWTADNGWFGGTIKISAGDITMELKKFGDDAKALLELPDTKKEGEGDKEGEKSPEKDK